MAEVELIAGKLKGTERDGIYTFKGIPYALPPVGEMRWQAPQAAWPWVGVLDASEYGSWAPQNKSAMDSVMGAEEGDQDESCLTLNVWTPGLDNANRPVLVWIHGGGFTTGSGAQGIYEGRTLSRHGDVVVVTINYRLGIFGFANLKEASGGRIPATGNEGLLDQAMALEWVQENIDMFGGDPNNVTILGESAGGMSIGALLALPEARGLFHKAIPQSGACHTVATMDSAPLVGEAILKATGLDVDGLNSASVEVLLRAQRHIEGGKVEGYPLSTLGSLPFRPVVDGRILPALPIDVVREGEIADIPIMAGSTLDEWRLFGALSPAIKDLSEENMRKRMGYLIGDAYIPRLIEAYKEGLLNRGIEPSPPEIFMAVQTDRIFRIPAIRLLESQQTHNPDVYSYIFDWKSPAARGELGACHAVELAYVFGTHTKPGAKNFYGDGPSAVTLATATMDAWTTFARTGKPGWQGYDTATRATRMFGEDCRTENAPMDIERAAWNEVPDSYLGSL
jgi:para-nitrobenzyl esterase